MKQLIICLTLVLMGVSVVNSQSGERRGQIQERMEAQRVAFITQMLKLTPEESAAFWPLYNEFKEKQKTMREEIHPGKPLNQLSEKEASDLLVSRFDLEVALVGLKREYFARLQDVVPATKLVRLNQAEQAFNRRILNAIRERRGNRE